MYFFDKKYSKGYIKDISYLYSCNGIDFICNIPKGKEWCYTTPGIKDEEGKFLSQLIEIRDMCKVYNPGENEVWALNHVDLSIGENEFVAIIGQSGSGKSTLMNMLGCLDVPTAGIYLLHGADVSELTDDELSDIRNKEIGFIFQGFNLIANLTALENVELPLIYRKVGKREREDLSTAALEKVGLGHRMDHKPAEMSGGQQQRVAIARAIAQAPPLILADEPTGNLDSASSAEILQILKKLHGEGRTVILITHDNDIAKQAQRIIKIRDGRIEKDYINEEFVPLNETPKNTENQPVLQDKPMNVQTEEAVLPPQEMQNQEQPVISENNTYGGNQ